MSYVIKSLVEWFTAIILELLRTLVGLIVQVSTPHPYWQDDWALNARSVVVAATWTYLTCKIAYESWRLYIARDAGEAIMPPGLLVRRAITAAAAIPLTGWALNWMMELSRYATGAIAEIGVEPDLYGWGMSLVETMITAVGSSGFGVLLMYGSALGAVVLMILLIYLQAFVRGAELALALIIGPACATSAAGNDEPLAAGALGMWIKEVTVLGFTGTMQLALMMGVVQYTLASGFEILNVLLSLPILYVTFKVPTLLRSYVYQGGSGGGSHSHMVIAMAGKALSKIPW